MTSEASLKLLLLGEDRSAGKTLRGVGKDADTAGQKVSGFANKAGKVLLGGTLAAGLAATIKSSVKLEATFSKTMAQVGVATNSGGEAMAKLDKLAMKLGADTAFSAGEAAGAMLELAKAGISTSDIMGGTLEGTLLLATAGSLELAEASTIASNAMNTFGLKGKDMNAIAAALAGGANASSASVQSLGQALQQVGPGATNAGLSLQETVGVLSAFDAAGVKGSDAGTSLKTMLSRLVPQTDAASSAMRKYNLDFVDAQGNFVSITQVADQLRKGLGGLSEAQRTTALTQIFGSDATRAATVLMKEGSAGVSKFIAATKDLGAAQKLADANMSGTAGAMEKLGGSVETAQLAIGKALAPTVVKLADFLSEEAVPALTSFITGMQDGTGAGGEAADVLKDVAAAGKAFVDVIDAIPGPVKKYGVEIAIAAVAMSKLRSMMGPTSAGLTGLVTRFRDAETRTAGLKSGLRGLGSGLTNIAGAGGMVLLADGANEAGTSMGALKSAAGGALSGAALGAFAGPLGAAIGGGLGGLAGLTMSLAKGTNQAAESAEVSIPSWKEYGSTLDGISASTSKATRQMVLQRLESSGLLTATRQLGLTDREAVNAMTGSGNARKKLAGAMAGLNNLTQQQKSALERETGAVGASRLATLKRNVALAETAAEVKLATAELKKFMKQPASKRMSITGREQAIANITAVKENLAALFSMKPVKNPGLVGGLGVLLGGTDSASRGPGISGSRALGGPVTAGKAYIVGETRPELFVPDQSGMIMPRVPAMATIASPIGGPAPEVDYDRLAAAILSALNRGTPLVRLSNAGQGAYLQGVTL